MASVHCRQHARRRGLYRWCWGRYSSLVAEETVPIPTARLEQLLEAEITTLALRQPRPPTLQNILASTSVVDLDDAASPPAAMDISSYQTVELGQLLHEELPVRYAQRIKMLEALPNWAENASIANVRQLYVTSFKELRLADPRYPTQFVQQLKNMQMRHSKTNLLVGGFKQYSEVDSLGEGDINQWLDRFFALRISTNMLISHYIQVSCESTTAAKSGVAANRTPYMGCIDPVCCPASIVEHAAHVVKRLCSDRYFVAPEICVTDSAALQAFPFVPRYMFYIVSELLKNAVRATVERHAGDVIGDDSLAHKPLLRREIEEALPPIAIVISGDERTCSIRISDEGGGIPLSELPRVWSYLYTTAAPVEYPLSRMAVDAPAELQSSEESCDDSMGHTMLMGSPLAGLGCGLPLSKLYARYLGGSVDLQTLPRFGTDVFVYLNRLGDSSEDLPTL
eukprot:gnl/TRDRNA2_/TRDRNA2_37253_c0_seq1.p1 gnl/TRDRNA2_/TRDRNA2_37253_c0~~gnl/TRDRNA2_/TRDRNA2_37253_c0_seq1.p1  ORF type:complete len:472 (+),score=67.68 gnl/TRDRNA2_/TRDRNA2_37253_c0_seq1:59-1417(+)